MLLASFIAFHYLSDFKYFLLVKTLYKILFHIYSLGLYKAGIIFLFFEY